MSEVIRREAIVPGGRKRDHKEAVGGGIQRDGFSAAYKRWLSWLSKLAKAKAEAEAEAPPTWAQALEEEVLSLSLMERIDDLEYLIGLVDLATGNKPRDISRKLDEDPDLERFVLDSVRLFQARYSLYPRGAATMRELLRFVLTDPVWSVQFKRFLKSEKLAAFHERVRLISQTKDPDFSGMSEPYRAAVADKLRQFVLEEARLLGDPELEARSRIIDFDPKQGGVYFNSYWCEDLSTFDLAEESPIGPLRFTKEVFEDNEAKVCTAVNILSVQVACSDVGFPIQVYGTVIARDSTDYKRNYLFYRDRDHCQFIYSEDEPLILTGPIRGLAMLDGNYVEVDLKIRDHQGQATEFSKGVFSIRGMVRQSFEEVESLSTRISTVKMVYAVVVSAVEATIALEVVEGKFRGTVTAHTTSIKKTLLLYDSQVAGHKHAGRGAVKMLRRVICVSVKDKLIITAKTARGGKYTVFRITPKVSQGNQGYFTLGTAKMRLQVDWSIMDPSLKQLALGSHVAEAYCVF